MAIVEKTYTATQAYSNYSADTIVSEFGGEEDLWGATGLTAETLNAPTFKILFDVTDIPGVLRVDGVEVEVFFRTPVAYTTDDRPFLPSPFAACTIGRSPAGGTRIMLVGSQGGIRISDDRGATWVDKPSGTAVQLWGCTYNSITATYTAVGDGGVVLRSIDFGETWATEDAQTSDPLYAVAAASEVNIAVGKDRGIRRRSANAWGN